MKAIEIKPIEKDGKVIGVEIPIIEKELLFEDISKEEMDWYEAMEYAKKKGKALLTKRELFILAYFMDDICKYYPDLRNMLQHDLRTERKVHHPLVRGIKWFGRAVFAKSRVGTYVMLQQSYVRSLAL